MIRSLYTAGSGILSGQRQVDTISNNIANINTQGYKEKRVNFSDVFYANLQQNKMNPSVDRLSTLGIQIGHGVMPSSVTKSMKQGSIITTGKTFDLAIEGQGFFGVNKDGQMSLTRFGDFSLDSKGTLVNPEGYPVIGDFSYDLLQFTNINVSSEGVVSGTDAEGVVQEIGTVHIYNVDNPKGLLAQANNLYITTENSGQPTRGQAIVRQGALEGSNVDLGEQLTRLIFSQRGLEASAKLIHSTDEMMSQANNLRR